MIAFTTWHRLEPKVRGADPEEGLRARVHDPLWLLGRQWQVGELLGEDAASPVAVRVESAEHRLTRWRSAAGDAVDYDPSAAPLEVLVEREPPTPPTLRDRLDAWSRLARLANDAGGGAVAALATIRAAHPLPAPRFAEDVADARLRLLAGVGVGDGLAAGQALRADTSGLPADVVRTFLAWLDAQRPEGAGDSWVVDRLEYRFSVGAHTDDGEMVLTAPEYGGGRLEWYDVDIDTDASRTLGAPADSAPSVVQHFLPTRVSFPGMPADRFWAFEDSAVDFGAVTASVGDLGRLAVVEFATVFGNDWYSVPVPTHFGALVGIRSLVVRDTFGQNTLVLPAATRSAGASASWQMFRLAGADLTSGRRRSPALLLLAPVVATALDGDPIEELLLLRDEMANLAWGVERAVEGADGRPRNRSTEYGTRLSAAVPPDLPSPAELVYRLQTAVPQHWIPLVAVHDPGGSAAVMLQRGALLTQDGSANPVPPQGILLQPEVSPWYLHQEEVPRAGRRIQRVPSVARWTDGTAYAWVSRRVSSGAGEGSSGLRFDVATPPTPTLDA